MNREAERKRLVELKRQFVENFDCGDCQPENEKCRKCLSEKEADHLLDNGIVVPTYKPYPVVMSEDENNSDVFCPFCNTDLSGHYYGGDYEPPKIVACFGCGTWLDGTKAITKEEAEKALGGGEK